MGGDGPLPPARWLVQNLSAAARAGSGYYTVMARQTGLTFPQLLVMATLWVDDALPVGVVCGRVGLSTATVSPLVRRLRDRGLVELHPTPMDARGTLVVLTRAGAELQDVAAPPLGAAAVGDGLAPAAREDLVDLLGDLTLRYHDAARDERFGAEFRDRRGRRWDYRPVDGGRWGSPPS